MDKTIGAAGIGAGVLLAIYTGISIMVARRLVQVQRIPIKKELTPASRGLVYEDVTFTSSEDNIQLKGWYIPSAGKSAIIFVNGGFQNRIDPEADTLGLAYDMAQIGHSLLLFDLRGRGDSGDGTFSISNMTKDVAGAVNYVKSRGFTSNQIYILGFSAGAAATCLYASQNSPGGIILDGCFARMGEALKKQVKLNGAPGLLTDIFIPGALMAIRVLLRDKLTNPVDAVSRIECPIFFIHEQKDVLITLEEVQELFNSSQNPNNEIWEINNALHSQSYKTHPFEYVTRLNRFLNKIASVSSN